MNEKAQKLIGHMKNLFVTQGKKILCFLMMVGVGFLLSQGWEFIKYKKEVQRLTIPPLAEECVIKVYQRLSQENEMVKVIENHEQKEKILNLMGQMNCVGRLSERNLSENHVYEAHYDLFITTPPQNRYTAWLFISDEVVYSPTGKVRLAFDGEKELMNCLGNIFAEND